VKKNMPATLETSSIIIAFVGKVFIVAFVGKILLIQEIPEWDIQLARQIKKGFKPWDVQSVL